MDIERLAKRRELVKAAVIRFELFLDKFDENKASRGIKATLNMLQLKLDNIKGEYEKFETVQGQIEELLEEDSVERQRFEDHYFAAIALGNKIIDRESKVQSELNTETNKLAQNTSALCISSNAEKNTNTEKSTNTSQSDSSVCQQTTSTCAGQVSVPSTILFQFELPEIEIPKFSGNGYDEWFPFKDTFMSLVDRHPNVSNVEKFLYLKSCLSESALSAIYGLPIKGESYQEAWKLLTKKFEAKNLIMREHIRVLFEIPEIRKENASALWKLIVTIKSRLSSLARLDPSVPSWDPLIIYLITNKLDADTRYAWEMELITKNRYREGNITMDNLMEFLIERARTLDRIDATFLKCYYCGQNHEIYNCQEFSMLEHHAKLSELQRLNLCSNCLKNGHLARQCRSSGGCKVRHKKHNTFLHV